METVEALRGRIDSARDLQSVVKTMKGLAAVNIRQYERAVESLADYAQVINLGFRCLLADRSAALFGEGGEDTGMVAAVVFGSDQGMCGPLNREIVAYAVEHMERTYPGRENVFAAMGNRAASELTTANQPPAATLRLPSSVAGLTSAVLKLLVRIEHWRFEKQASRILLFHHRIRQGAGYEPVTVPLLPMDDAWLAKMAGTPWPTHVLPAYTMSWDTLFAALVREYLFVSVFQSMAESLASENASRLAAMQSAENKIEERIDGLQARYRQKRQSAITEELLDVISGFEALGEG